MGQKVCRSRSRQLHRWPPSRPHRGHLSGYGGWVLCCHRVYGYWGATSYVANWHAWGNGESGLWTPRQSFSAITDGLSNTILFGEAYAWCDGLGRIALYSWWYHNFGLNQDNVPNTLMFQVQPGLGRCATCCDNWRAQTAHQAMNVAMADGSVRAVKRGVSQETWDRLLLPCDGGVLGSDW